MPEEVAPESAHPPAPPLAVSYQTPGQKDAAKPRQVYNIVTDTVIGPNVRLRDNLFQGVACVVGAIIGAVIALLVMSDHMAALMVGGFLGLVAGLFLSGIGLMIYRAMRHLQRKHD